MKQSGFYLVKIHALLWAANANDCLGMREPATYLWRICAQHFFSSQNTMEGGLLVKQLSADIVFYICLNFVGFYVRYVGEINMRCRCYKIFEILQILSSDTFHPRGIRTQSFSFFFFFFGIVFFLFSSRFRIFWGLEHGDQIRPLKNRHKMKPNSSLS
jgi:hypothetical protein